MGYEEAWRIAEDEYGGLVKKLDGMLVDLKMAARLAGRADLIPEVQEIIEAIQVPLVHRMLHARERGDKCHDKSKISSQP